MEKYMFGTWAFLQTQAQSQTRIRADLSRIERGCRFAGHQECGWISETADCHPLFFERIHKRMLTFRSNIFMKKLICKHNFGEKVTGGQGKPNTFNYKNPESRKDPYLLLELFEI